MTRVPVTNGNIDGALKKFKVKVARSGVPSELKKRKHYVKRGVAKRIEKSEQIKNSHKKIRKERNVQNFKPKTNFRNNTTAKPATNNTVNNTDNKSGKDEK